MDIRPSKRMNGMGTGIFADLAARKRDISLKGVSVIDLSVGSPDLPPPSVVMDTLQAGIRDPSKYGYALTGTPQFSDAVAAFYQRRYGVRLDPGREVVQLMGSQDGLAHLSTALLDEGDYVLVPDPGYPIYAASVRIAGGNLYPIPLLEENHFLPNLGDIPDAVAERAKMMIVNYPGNPVTALATPEFFEELVAFAQRYNILVVHDFAYSELVFDGIRPVSFLSIPGAKDVGIEFNSLSKTFNMAGCRIGYAVGHERALSALSLLKSQIDYGVFHPIQTAAEAALRSDFSALDAQVAIYQRRRDALTTGLRRAGWWVEPSPATMFTWAKTPAGWTSQQFVRDVLDGAGVLLTPGDAFGDQGEGYVRIALVQPEDVLSTAADRIGTFLAGQQA